MNFMTSRGVDIKPQQLWRRWDILHGKYPQGAQGGPVLFKGSVPITSAATHKHTQASSA